MLDDTLSSVLCYALLQAAHHEAQLADCQSCSQATLACFSLFLVGYTVFLQQKLSATVRPSSIQT